MAIDYVAIRRENIKKYGTDFDQYGPVLLENLYSDQTHFAIENDVQPRLVSCQICDFTFEQRNRT